MCGIAGILHHQHQRPVSSRKLRAMADALAHRGPDDSGSWSGEGVGLAHRRLSIIDLSPAGRQPMSNEDGTVWTILNGEIYNFQELRDSLESSGHRFRSRTDTEVIVHLYEDHGPDFVEKLEGMFALALWDDRRRRLVLARDRLGKKPLKYAQVNGSLLFASELKALLATGDVPAETCDESILAYLAYGYVPCPDTGLRHVRKLPPGHLLVVEDGKSRLRRYWNVDFREKRSMGVGEWKEAVRSEVEAAVRRRLISDVPLGAFLSGGIDSTIVVACMARSLSRPVETFSIGFEFESHDELPFARQVAELYRTSHHEFVVRAETASILPDLARIYEEPYADSSALPSWYLARETRGFVTVALNGDGGDESFAGYSRYSRLERWTGRLGWLGALGLHRIARTGASLGLPAGLARRLEALGNVTDPDLAVRYAWMMRVFSDRDRARLFGRNGGGSPRTAGDGLREFTEALESGGNRLDRMLYADLMTYLPDDLLVKMDMATMAHGLEARSPLLDHKVVELAAAAPPELKYRSGQLKWLLREAFRDLIPESLLARRKKGFSIPLDAWFRTSLKELFHDLVLDGSSRICGYLDRSRIRRVVREHDGGRVDHGNRLWALLMLELWHRQVVEAARPLVEE